jgi:hypothetical protein
MFLLQAADLVRPDERDSQLTLLDSLRCEHRTGELLRGRLLDGDAAPVGQLDRHRHRRRCVPVSSEWSLYASTMCWTSLCRTTSSCVKRTNAIPSIEPKMSCT